MAIPQSDGKIVLEVEANTSGIKKSTNELRSEAMKLAAQYRKAGMTQSEAQKKAYRELGVTTKETEKATKATKKYGEQAKKSGGTAKSAFSSVGGALKKLSVAAAAAFSVKKIIQFTAEASNLATKSEASVQRLIDIYGEASKAVGDFIDANAQALGMSRTAAASYASVYGNLFSVWADQATNAQLTNAYLNMTAVVASKTGRTVEDVQERIRSGLLGNTEAIEDLGVFVNVKTIEMTDAFQRMADGKSWEQLDAYAQQQIRTMAILEQATSKYGDEVAQTSALTKSRLQAAWQYFQATWGMIINRVLVPALEVLTSILIVSTKVMQYLAGISGETIKQGEAIDNATEKQKEFREEIEKTNDSAKKSLATFDEIKTLSGGGTEDNSASGADKSVGIGIGINVSGAEQVDSIAQKMEGVFDTVKAKAVQVGSTLYEDFKPSIDAISNGLPQIGTAGQEAFSVIKQATSDVYNNSLVPLANQIATEFVPDIVNSTVTNLSPIASDIASVAIETFAETYEWGAQKIEQINTDIVQPALDTLTTMHTDSMDAIGVAWDEYGEGITEQMQEADNNARSLWDNLYQKVGKPIFQPLMNEINKLWEKHLKPLWQEITKFWASLTEFALAFWNNILSPLINYIMSIVGPKIVGTFNTIVSAVSTVISIIADTVSGIMKSLRGLLDFLTGVFTGDWKKAWNGVKTFVKGIWDTIWGTIRGTINLIIDGLNALWRGVYSVFSGIANGIGSAVGWVGKLFGADWGFSLPANPPLIPKLAQGAVIPPNREFLAVLGDQKHGTNIEAPLQTIVDAFNIALDSRGAEEPIQVHMYLDGKEVYDVIVNQNKKNTRITGVNALAY